MLAPAWIAAPPRFIPRSVMPQIASEDLTALMEWIAWRGIKIVDCTLPVAALRFHQRVSMKRVRTMPAWAYDSPILVSVEPWVLDGNHRAVAHKLRGDPIRCLQLSTPFSDAMRVLFEFAGTRLAQKGE